MTNYVKRGAGRPTANAKRTRAAQRTPLPPKGTPIRDPQISDALQQEGLDEVRPGGTKAALFAADATAAGWVAGITQKDDITEVVAVRETGAGEEMLYCSWQKSRAVEQPLHKIAGFPQARPRNVSAARVLLLVPAADVHAVAGRKALTEAASMEKKVANGNADAPGVRNVPWDSESTDFEILSLCAGRKIVWLNSISQKYENAFYPTDGATAKIVRGSDGRARLSFAAVGTGFRAVHLDSIFQVL